MNQFFASILLLEESEMVALNLGLIVVGAVLSAIMMTVEATFRRVVYLLWVAGLSLALTISQFVWVLTPDAADAGFLWLLALNGFGAFAAFGAGFYYAAAARSRHIGGDTSRAWLGFIPIANLWLMFAPGQKFEGETRTRTNMERYIADPAMVIFALFVILVSRGVDNMSQDIPYFDAADSTALKTMLSDTMTLVDFFEREVGLSRADLPMKVDEVTTWTGIEADGKTIRFVYTLTPGITGMRDEFKNTLAEQFCSEQIYGHEIRRGGTVEVV